MSRIAIVTDAWFPQVNGVVRTLSNVVQHLEALGHDVLVIAPDAFRTLPCPSYPSIRLAVFPRRGVAKMLAEFAADSIHISTEGPLGLAARHYCVQRRLAYTSAYHSRYPQYVRLRAPVPEAWTYAWLRRFHNRSERTLVPTPSIKKELEAHGFYDVAIWSRGVDTNLFRPVSPSAAAGPGPVMTYVGRVAIEKNIDAFLSLKLPGTKYVIGDGPDRAALEKRFPDAVFVGFQHGEALVDHLCRSDVTVFPSLTDTFGLTILESLACGIPVAAFPVSGPIDIIREGHTGALDWDLGQAIMRALTVDRQSCVDVGRRHSWRECAESLAGYLVPANSRPLQEGGGRLSKI